MSETYWAVIHPKYIAHWTIKRLRRDAIAAFVEPRTGSKTWADWQKDGYRCRKVKVTPVS